MADDVCADCDAGETATRDSTRATIPARWLLVSAATVVVLAVSLGLGIAAVDGSSKTAPAETVNGPVTAAVGMEDRGSTDSAIIAASSQTEQRELTDGTTREPPDIDVLLSEPTVQRCARSTVELTLLNSGTVARGVDYVAHFSHRFADEVEGYSDTEVEAALRTAAQGTGGALTGSMLTTTLGVGALCLAVTPLIASFGVVSALGVLYAYLASMFVSPSAIVVGDRLHRAVELR